MAVLDQLIADRFAVYNGDAIETMRSLPDRSVHLSVYSPPFCGLYVYSSSERDLSNARSYSEFMTHYEFVVREIHRLTLPGRITAVHCMDVPRDGANLNGGLLDFPGDIIRMHERLGWSYCARYHVWKEPLAVRNRTMAKGLAHRQLVEDSSLCDVASADYLMMFRKRGTNLVPIAHPTGLTEYAGSRPVPPELLSYRNWKGKQTENRYSHWIWRQYASAFWDDVRLDRVLPYKEARDSEDEKHMHPLQLDVIDRCLTLWSNPGETVLTPFMGVGSEVYSAVRMGRKAIGIELKPSYYRQAIRNLETVEQPAEQRTFFDLIEPDRPADPEPDPGPGMMDDPEPDPSPEAIVDGNSQVGNPNDAPVIDPAPPEPGPKPAKPKRSRKPKEAPSAIADVARAMFPPPADPWSCDCGWTGLPRDMSNNPSGSRTCPKCGGSGGLVKVPLDRMPNATGDGCINLGRKAESGPVPDNSRIVWTDRDGSEWNGMHRFTVGDLASITLDEVSPGVPVARFLRVDPATLRAEATESMEVAS